MNSFVCFFYETFALQQIIYKSSLFKPTNNFLYKINAEHRITEQLQNTKAYCAKFSFKKQNKAIN